MAAFMFLSFMYKGLFRHSINTKSSNKIRFSEEDLILTAEDLDKIRSSYMDNNR